MFVVYISAAAVGLLEVVTTTVAVLELCTHIVAAYSLDKGFPINNIDFVRIQTVGFIPSAVGKI